MCSVNVHLLLFILTMVMMIVKGEPGKVISTILCSGAELMMQVNHTAVAVTVFYNKKEIAKCSDVSSMKWDKSLPENYKGRLSIRSQSNITIKLQFVSEFDTGLFRIVTKASNGNRRPHDWNVTVLVPPSVEKNAENISITEDRLNDSCSKLTCGSFSSLGIPEVNFEWTVSDSKEQTVIVCKSDHCECHVVGPATKCLKGTLSAGCCISNVKRRRRRRSLDDKPCSCDDPISDDPINPVPIVLGVLAAIAAIAVITVITVFCVRRSRNQGVQGPPVNYDQAPVDDNQDM